MLGRRLRSSWVRGRLVGLAEASYRGCEHGQRRESHPERAEGDSGPAAECLAEYPGQGAAQRNGAEAARERESSESPGKWAWQDPHLDLTTPRDRIVRATLDLVTRPELRLLHQCADKMCGWVYLDTSPRHNRRWCSATGCGNRNRARRFYERRHAGDERS